MKKIFNKIIMPFLCLSILVVSCSKDSNINDKPGFEDEEEVLESLSGIALIRDLYRGTDVTLEYMPLKAVVVSENQSGNMESTLIAVQEQNTFSAILLEISGGTVLSPGDEVNLGVTDAVLTTVGEELVIKGLSKDSIEATGNKVNIIPRIVNISEVKRRAAYWGPILVNIQKAEIKGGVSGKYNGKLFFKNGIDSVASRVLSTASFFDNKYPEYAKSIIGIARVLDNEAYVNIRNEAEVVAGDKDEDPGDPTNPVIIIEDFEGATLAGYGTADLNFVTGNWTIQDGMTAKTADDPKTGTASIRIRNGLLKMNFDYKGVKEIGISYARYPASAEVGNVNPTTLDVEMSTDGGLTYTLLKQIVVPYDPAKRLELYSTTIPLTVDPELPVRFRVVNSSQLLSATNKPRINIDDFLFKF